VSFWFLGYKNLSKIWGGWFMAVDMFDAIDEGGGTEFQKDMEIEVDIDTDGDEDEEGQGKVKSAFDLEFDDPALTPEMMKGQLLGEDEEDNVNLDEIDNILELTETQFPKFTLAKNKARFLRMVSWYRNKEEWIEVAPLSGVTKLFKQQTKELEGIRSSKLDYEMELETGTLTPSQRSYRRDELKMCKVQEKMAVHLISKLQLKIKSGRR
tara:strand:- start:23031 stop:23660 length:630 start_codon:yes stop_codon:yes gene_type:complete